ncbi:DUF1097 domain-containing protein [Vibrio parahaemolyticus]|nr:DUF1097 domain-containing protein [Vibrio parahaemolyticus]
MTTLLAISITTGILSGVWGWIAISLGLLSWAGFLGCTSYFAAPTSGLKGLATSLITNLTGVFWAMVIIYGSTYAGLEILGYVITAVVAFFMCIQAKQACLAYIPGTFIGSCATFAADGNWQLVVPSLVLGGVFGYLMKATGLWLHAKSTATSSSLAEQAQ